MFHDCSYMFHSTIYSLLNKLVKKKLKVLCKSLIFKSIVCFLLTAKNKPELTRIELICPRKKPKLKEKLEYNLM